MKKYIYIAIAILIIGSLLGNIFLSKRVSSLSTEVSHLETIRLGYEQENSSLKEDLNSQAIRFEYNIAQLSFSKDSILQKLNNARNELRIKDKQLKELAYISSQANIKDTLILRDTLFREQVSVDTTINNPWYKLNLTLNYPSKITTAIEVPSEKVLITHSEKVVLNPSKCAFINWFKKKQTIVEVEVLESNPYIVSKQNKFIEIIK